MSHPIAIAPPLSSVEHAVSDPRHLDAALEVGWAAWLARGKEHDRVVRRRMRIVAPILAVLAALAALLLIR